MSLRHPSYQADIELGLANIPAGYTKDQWTTCRDCNGEGTWDQQLGGGHGAHGSGSYNPKVICAGCGGEGGWPTDARRFDDEELPAK